MTDRKKTNKKAKPLPSKKAGKGNGCPLFKKCGGCQMVDIPYEKHYARKLIQADYDKYDYII